MMSNKEFDAIVVGARCAGSATASYLARAGYQVLMLDRTFFPSDVVSTHTIFNNTVDCLNELGVLDKLLETDTPAVINMRAQFDDVVVESSMPSYNGESRSYCFRRTHFDKIMLDHARAYDNVTAIEGVRVTELIKENGVVVGVRAHDREGNDLEYRAKIVIGADGRVSTVRKAADAELKFSEATEYATYYGYFENFKQETPKFEIYQIGILRAYIFATSDGQHVVAATFPNNDADLVAAFRQDGEKALREYMGDFLPDGHERLADARLVEPVKGLLHFDNHWYQGMGDGWAIVGDAVCFKDPGMGQGMHDAIFGARILAGVLSRYEDWRASSAEMQQAYQQELEAEFMARFQACVHLTKVIPFSEEDKMMHQVILHDETARQAFFGFYNYTAEREDLGREIEAFVAKQQPAVS
ncbi:MAG TPA: NAD(P)/FAD-dependent oxidoreductase [Bacilli bacterium]|nr:NAD(P)/FAD-dependent oxidoreductase [Bacilli bacterium]